MKFCILDENLETYFNQDFLDKVSVEELSSLENVYIVFDPFEKNYFDISKEYNVHEKKHKLLAIGDIKDKKDFFVCSGCAIWSKDFVENDNFSRDLEEFLFGRNGESGEVQKFKITDFYNYGYYSDHMTKFAFDNKVDFLSVRSSFYYLINYIYFLNKGGISYLPTDIDYYLLNKKMYVDVYVSVENFYIDYISKSYDKSNEPFLSSLHTMDQFTNYVEYDFYESTSILKISLSWPLDNKNYSRGNTTIRNITKYNGSKAKMYSAKMSIDREINELKGIMVKEDLPGSFIRATFEDGPWLSNYPVHLSNVVRYLNNIIEYDYPNRPKESFLPFDIKSLMLDYPDQTVVDSLNKFDYEMLVDFICEDQDFHKIQGVTNIFVDDIIKVKGKTEVDNFITRISGMDFNEASDVFRVTGKYEVDGDKIIVKGSNEEVCSKDVWQVKRLEIEKKLKEASEDINSVDELKEKLDSVLSSELGIEDMGQVFINNKLADNISEQISEKTKEQLQKISQHYADKLNGLTSISRLEEKDKKIHKLSDYISMLKSELQSLKKQAEITHSSEGSSIDDVERIKELMKESEKKDLIIQKLKLINSDNNAKAQEQIVDLRQRLNESFIATASGRELEQKDQDIQKLSIQIESYEEKMVAVQAKYDQIAKKIHEEGKLTKEEVDKRINESVEQYVKENNELKKELERLNIEYKKADKSARENENIAINEDTIKKQLADKYEDQIAQLKKEAIEYKTKTASELDEAKVAKLKVKELEQKIKFLTVQLETTQKQLNKKGGSNGSFNNSSNDAQVNHKIKQFEKLNEKLKAEANKAQKSTKEKSKELVQFKQENTALKNELDNLKRKLSKYERGSAA